MLKAYHLDPLEKTLKERARVREQWGNNPNNPIPPNILPPLAMTRSEQNYFIVFDSNAAALGKINDEKLREKIIRVYSLSKGLVDTLNANSRDFENWRRIPEASPEKQVVARMLDGLEAGLQNGLSVLQLELSELVPEI